MKRDNFRKGKVGEAKAIEFLTNKGYKVIEKSFRTRFGEIDLIMEKDEVVIFVEVKTKTGDEFGEPWEMVNKNKLEQVKRLGKFFLVKNGLNVLCRVDVVGVWISGDEVEKIEHWENVE